jgi:hypothetical protein
MSKIVRQCAVNEAILKCPDGKGILPHSHECNSKQSLKQHPYSQLHFTFHLITNAAGSNGM